MKKFFLAVAVAAIASVNVYKVNTAKAYVSDMSLNNVEQLAEAECGFGYHCKYFPREEKCIVCNGPWSYCPELECKGKF